LSTACGKSGYYKHWEVNLPTYELSGQGAVNPLETFHCRE